MLLAVVKRECGDVEDVLCRKRIGVDVTSTALYYEAQANVSLGGLRSLLTKMSGVPGRKTLILVSGGLIEPASQFVDVGEDRVVAQANVDERVVVGRPAHRQGTQRTGGTNAHCVPRPRRPSLRVARLTRRSRYRPHPWWL